MQTMPKIKLASVKNKQRSKRWLSFFVSLAFVVIGPLIIIKSRASVPSESFEPENGIQSGVGVLQGSSASNGKSICFSRNALCSDQSFRRFFADDASWNKTVSQMGGEFTELKPFAQRFYDFGGGVENGSSPGITTLSLKDYSTPIYDYTDRDQTKSARAFQVGWSQNQQSFSHSGFRIGDNIPWNSSWKPGTGNDNILHIVNYQTGEAWEVWGVGQNKALCNDIFGPNNQAGYDANNANHLCVASVEHYTNLYTAIDGSTIVGRGMGINNLALVVRAKEVASGNIGHAIPLTVTNAMFGPAMVSPKDDPLQSGAGFTKGFYVKPATRLEHESGTTLANGPNGTNDLSDTMRAKTVPSGMRFAINVTDTDINNWLDYKNYTGVKRTTAATFARAWRDYGGVVAETGRFGIRIETDGVIGPAKQDWANLGLYNIANDSISNIDFEGLITRDNVYVVKTPN